MSPWRGAPTFFVILAPCPRSSAEKVYHRLLTDAQLLTVLPVLAFGLGVTLSLSPPRVTSEELLDAWGEKVLGRAVTATWSLWGAYLALHILVWGEAQGQLNVLTFHLVTVAILLAALRMRMEAWIWILVLPMVFFGHVVGTPGHFVITVMCAVVLALKGRHGVTRSLPSAAPEEPEHPCRVPHEAPGVCQRLEVYHPRRLYVGATCLVQLAALQAGWQYAPLYDHVTWVGLLFTGVFALMAYRWRLPSSALALLVTAGHVVSHNSAHLVPRSHTQWGATQVTSGFALLIIGLLINWSLRHDVEPAVPGEGDP